MVFQTAPPQPASKARMICSPQLVGGAEASQKGFGASMRPAKLCTLISGIGRLRNLEDGLRSALAIGHSVHYFAATVSTVSSGEVARIARLSSFRIGHDHSAAQFNAAQLLH